MKLMKLPYGLFSFYINASISKSTTFIQFLELHAVLDKRNQSRRSEKVLRYLSKIRVIFILCSQTALDNNKQ